MSELPSSPVLNQRCPGASVDPCHVPPLYQKSSATNPFAIPPLVTSPFAVHALLMVIPGGAVVDQDARCHCSIPLLTWSDIGQPEGALVAERSPPRPKAPKPAV